MNEAQRTYQRLRSLWNLPRKTSAPAERPGSQPFADGRDPQGLSDVFSFLAEQFGWTKTLAEHEIFARWAEIVGVELATHAQPTEMRDGVLFVRCDSSAWATQLGFLRHDLIRQIQDELPGAGVTGIKFLGPDAPNWKRGIRTAPGRGPRDTYG